MASYIKVYKNISIDWNFLDFLIVFFFKTYEHLTYETKHLEATCLIQKLYEPDTTSSSV